MTLIDPEDELDLLTLEELRSSAEASCRKSFGLLPWMAAIHQPEPGWLIPGFLQEQAIHVISSQKGSFKTWLGLSAMLAGIYNFKLLDHFDPGNFNSIYIAADSPQWDINRQMRNILGAYELSPTTHKNAASFVAPLGFNLDDKDHLTYLAQLVQAHNIKAIFFDVMLYVHAADENNDREMAAVMRRAKFLRDDLGLAVVFLHHHAKTTGAARGADTILQASEHHYVLRRNRSEGTVRLIREKVRGEEDWTELLFKLDKTPHGKKLTLVPAVGIADSAATPLGTPEPRDSGLLEAALASGSQRYSSLLAFSIANGKTKNWLNRTLATLKSEGKIVSPSRGTWRLA